MDTASTTPNRRRILKYGLRSFFLAVAIICIGLGWLANEVGRARRQAAIVEQLRGSNAIVLYDYHADHGADEDVRYDFDKNSPVPLWLRSLLGPDFLVKPEMVYCEDLSDDDLEILADLDSITILELNMSPLTGRGLSHLSQLSQLRSLSLAKTKLFDNSLAPLSEIASLEHFDLSYTPVSDAGLVQLQRFTQLSILSLRGTECSDRGPRYLEALGNLVELNLTETDVTTVAVDRLRTALPQCEIDYGFYFYDYDSKEFRHSPTRPPAMKVEYSQEEEIPPPKTGDEKPPRVHGGVI